MTDISRRIVLERLAFVGPSREEASIELTAGVNVICGASDTGKSFLIEVIDYMLGGQPPLRDIPERVGYDRCRLSLAERGATSTIERSVAGGGFLLYQGVLRDQAKAEPVGKLGEKHSGKSENSLSKWLLSAIGLNDKQIRKNKKGEARSLSFRDIARLVVVDEAEIIRRTSPFLSGQPIGATAEYSTLKLLLTGIDDSAIVSSNSGQIDDTSTSVKVEILTEMAEELREEIKSVGASRAELVDQLDRLEESVSQEAQALELLSQDLEAALEVRRKLATELETTNQRRDEISDLLVRFSLLEEHYIVDIERLLAIAESGTMFMFQSEEVCPLCGADPEHQNPDSECEADVSPVIEAAKAEIEKVRRLTSDLRSSMQELRTEDEALAARVETLKEELYLAGDEISQIETPKLGKGRESYANFVDERADVRASLKLYENLGRLEDLLASVENDQDVGKTNDGKIDDIPKSVLHEYSKKVESILQAWNFPDAKDVYFDESDRDFVINGKARGGRGKGLRAVTHAAASIALLEYCSEKDLPHPGFIVLDSPLLSYWEPEGEEDNLEGTGLDEKFYQYLAAHHQDSQILIVDNRHPPQSVEDSLSMTVFTSNPNEGRFGFFPSR